MPRLINCRLEYFLLQACWHVCVSVFMKCDVFPIQTTHFSNTTKYQKTMLSSSSPAPVEGQWWISTTTAQLTVTVSGEQFTTCGKFQQQKRNRVVSVYIGTHIIWFEYARKNKSSKLYVADAGCRTFRVECNGSIGRLDRHETNVYLIHWEKWVSQTIAERWDTEDYGEWQKKNWRESYITRVRMPLLAEVKRGALVFGCLSAKGSVDIDDNVPG